MSTNARKAPKGADPAEAPEAQADQDEQEQAPEADQEPQACRVVFEKDPATGRVFMTTEGCSEDDVEQISEQLAEGDYWIHQGGDPDQTTLVLVPEDEIDPEQEPGEDEVDPEDEPEEDDEGDADDGEDDEDDQGDEGDEDDEDGAQDADDDEDE